MPEATGNDTLHPDAIIGLNGSIPNGYSIHPNGSTVVYPIGAEVIIQDLSKAHKQNFLLGHSRPITCCAVSPSGKYIATGDETKGGFKADLIVWEYATRKQLYRFSLHKVRVQALAFSPDEKYLVSLGGQDDNGLILWDVEKGKAISGAVASKDTSGATVCLAFCRKNSLRFATGGDRIIRIWDINPDTLKMTSTDCQLGNIKRNVNCITVDFKDEMMYCGTTTGDVLQININTGLFVKSGPVKVKDYLGGGVTSVRVYAAKGVVYAGSGGGTIANFDISNMSLKNSAALRGSVTTLAFKDPNLYVVTATCDVYSLNQNTLNGELISTNHDSAINAICFPKGTSELFVTASETDIRLWNLASHKELLRIKESGISCKSVVFKRDGTSIITGWSDGKIRAYGPETGKLQYIIHDAHKGSVCAIAASNKIGSDGQFKIISGGEDGLLRQWEVTLAKQKLLNSMKEHKGSVTAIHLRKNDLECASSSNDGSCIMWDLEKGTRIQIMFNTAAFKGVKYFPDESQILTVAADGKVGYWEAFDGNLIRDLESQPAVSLNSLDITADGNYFVVGGSDHKIKCYNYDEGKMLFVGKGHSTEISKLAISPNQKRVISVGVDGSIFVWTLPVLVGEPLKPIV